MSFQDALEALAPLLDQITAGVQLIDDDMRYRYLNQAAAQHGRSSTEALLGRTMSECYPGIEHTEIYKLIQEVSRTGRSNALQNAFTFPDGSQGWFEVRLYKVPGGVVVMSTDTTARKSLELHVRHADRMEATGKLAGGIAHDFNNLLMIISSIAELSAEDPALPADHRADLGEVLVATQRASQLTKKLLTLSRQFPGSRTEVVSLKRFVEQRFSTITSIVGPQTTVVTTVPPEIGAVKIDPSILEQLLIHLAKNAHDAMGISGTLTITASIVEVDPNEVSAGSVRVAPGQYASIRVADTGPGIRAEIIEKIFDPFFTTRAGPERGLGLAVCWGLVEQAGGTIRVDSTPGRGAVFELLLPRVEEEESVLSKPASAKLLESDGARILVVDDERSVGRLVCALLERLGHSTVGVASGPEALVELSATSGIDLVITDLVMPGMSGLELVKHIRASGHDMPILLMSGYSPDHHALRNVPRACLLSKPFSQLDLKTAVDAALREGAERLEG